LLASSQGYGQFLLLLLALGVIVPTVVVTFGVRRITDPVAQLIAAAKEIAGGQFGQQITVHTGDELEELVKQFNLMSAQLSESYAQLEQRVAARTHELSTLNAITAVAGRSLNLNQVLNDALAQTLEAMRMELGAAYGPEENGEAPSLMLFAARGLSEAFVRALTTGVLPGNAVERAASDDRPLVWPLAAYPEATWRQWWEREGARQIVGVPLCVKGKLVGAFELATNQPREFSAEELSLLAAIGQQTGIAVENARLYDQAEQSAAVAERTRLARELHDSVTQSLYSVTLYAEAAATLLMQGDHQTAADHLRELRDTAQEALREMRLLIFELRPLALEKMGLAAALQARLDAVEGRGGLKIELQVEGTEQLPRVVQQELYHIAQEALNNVLKHADAQHVRVQLRFSAEGACLEVQDDGAGFDTANPPKGRMGLAGMRERAQKIGAELEIASAPGRGTRVSLQVRLISPRSRDGDQIQKG
jgi:nitrate/nitrite-specific signal transduction histidine kinase